VGAVETDYDRACDQTDYVGIISCGSSKVLVLGDEPMRSAFFVKEKGLIIVRWVSCISAEHAANAITQLPAVLPAIEASTKIVLDDSDLIMFDAALESVDPFACQRVELEPGVFTVTAEKYKSEGIFEFLIHRLLRDPVH
jgi:hypothetical protein